MADNQCNNDMNEAISDIEKCFNGSHTHELKALKKAFKTFQLEHKVELMEKDLQIKDKEIRFKKKETEIQAKEAQIAMLKKENEALKIKCKIAEEEDTTKSQPPLKENEIEIQQPENGIESRNEVEKIIEIASKEECAPNRPQMQKEKQIEPVKSSVMCIKNAHKSFEIILNDLLQNGIKKFFCDDELNHFYKDWFNSIFESLRKDSPVITEKFVLVKVKCKDTTKQYYVNSTDQNKYGDNYTHLNIFNKGRSHENTKLLILHPNSINNAIQMKKVVNWKQWIIDTIPKEYIGEDGYFIVLCLKK